MKLRKSPKGVFCGPELRVLRPGGIYMFRVSGKSMFSEISGIAKIPLFQTCVVSGPKRVDFDLPAPSGRRAVEQPPKPMYVVVEIWNLRDVSGILLAGPQRGPAERPRSKKTGKKRVDVGNSGVADRPAIRMARLRGRIALLPIVCPECSPPALHFARAPN